MFAVMMISYAAACFTHMKWVAFIYLMFVALNFAVYPVIEMEFMQGNTDWPLMYAISEEFLKIVFISRFCDRRHLPLIFLLICHIINHAFIVNGYLMVNTAIIALEVLYIGQGVLYGVSRFFKNSFYQDIRRNSYIGGVK